MAAGWWSKMFRRKASSALPAGQVVVRDPCYIKFKPLSADALAQLTAIVEAFKLDRTEEKERSDEKWERLFSPEQLATFWYPDEKEREQWQSYWFSTPLPKRHSAEMPSPGWHFGSMVEAIAENADYDLVGVRLIAVDEALLEFIPHAYPYGGTGALRALVRAFGHRVIGVDDGTGYEPGDPQQPRWTPDMTVEG